MKYDYLIVGSGLYGAVFAYLAHKAGKRCLVIDKRPQLGGNIFCSSVEGINVHTYGAHIFHTSNKDVWNFVNNLVPFNRYTNSPVANYKGTLYNLPFNMNTFYQMWGTTTPDAAKAEIEKQKADAAAALQAAGCSEPRNLEEQALLLVGRDMYQKLIKGYTEKQWGRKCTDLPAFIIRRLPVRFTFDNNYFNDAYQGIPIGGYNILIQKLLAGIETKAGTDFFSDRPVFESMADHIVFTGRIDEYYGYVYGGLEYRTVRFETDILQEQNHQGNAVINYTDAETPYTRIIEHKHFEPESPAYGSPVTVISREYSSEWHGNAEPFYPVNDSRNSSLYEQYKARAVQEKNTLFGGRLAEYKYYDMDDIIEKVFKDTQTLFNR